MTSFSVIVSPRAMITARSTAFFSSRTFPGQWYDEDPLPRGVVEVADLLAVLAGESREKLRREQLDVLRPLAQRRKIDLDDGEPIVEILAQLAVG